MAWMSAKADAIEAGSGKANALIETDLRHSSNRGTKDIQMTVSQICWPTRQTDSL